MTQALTIGVFSAFLNVFINYCIGKPGSKEFSPYEVFSWYTVWLSKMKLKRIGLWKQYEQQYAGSIKEIPKFKKIELKNDFSKVLYEAADPFFTWERAVGMCSICTGFWISLGVGLVFTNNFMYLIAIVLLSHITTRLLNKLIL